MKSDDNKEVNAKVNNWWVEICNNIFMHGRLGYKWKLSLDYTIDQYEY